ncbi:hypothetical protein EXIGLDRAFT_831411 [Exidia glandulosa HHB12029]|uniref:F-box domain-containing protein n=1 Tax=Exidia glandulosa HHB12029 TaxID=1314781 RepID=A0A165MM11_EXIGL|nr:hypothetical protein EXIGLDRAFT_831411 [Exidia glandulosa HHB12029]
MSVVIGNAIARMRQEFDEAVSAYACRYNERTWMCRLPDELLAEVFHHLALADRITSSHVCRSWRTVSLATPSLWSHVWSALQPPGILSARVARVLIGAPLRLFTILGRKIRNEVTNVLQERLSDLRYLWLRIIPSLTDAELHCIRTALSQSAPDLKHMTLICGGVSQAIEWYNYPLLANNAPQLRSIRYDGFIQDLRNWPVAAQLVSVHFAQPGLSTTLTLSQVFELLVNVDTLGIEIDLWAISHRDSAQNTELEMLTLPHRMRALVIFSTRRETDPGAVLPVIPHGNIPVFAVGHIKRAGILTPASLIAEVTHSLPYPVIRIIITSFECIGWEDEQVDVHLYTPQHERVFMCSDLTLRQGLEMFSHTLTDVSITEGMLVDGSGVYDMPHVVNLSIALLKPTIDVHRSHQSIFLLDRTQRNPLLACPQLAGIVLLSYAGTITTVAPELVREFIQFHIECNPQNVVLMLGDVEIIQSNVTEVASLLAYVLDLYIGDMTAQSDMYIGTTPPPSWRPSMEDPDSTQGNFPPIRHLFTWNAIEFGAM